MAFFYLYKTIWMALKRKVGLYWIGALLTTILILNSCASSGTLRGGPKDVSPPSLITEKSTPNFQTNFRPKTLLFEFDEYIVVANALQQIVVSPPLTYIPQAKSRGKKVTFTFGEDEILKDETTYTINFGEAIKDFRENNILDNFSYVFSTGDILDSLYLQGTIVDAITGEPVEKATIMLYDTLADSIIVQEKPYYFAKTDKDGNYKVANLKNDTFKVVVIKDENSSYTYNQNIEQLGFLDDFIIFPDSTDHLDRDMQLSMPYIDYRVFNENTEFLGQIKIKLNTSVYEEPLFTLSDDNITSWHRYEGDSLFLFYEIENQINIDSFYVEYPFDTLKVIVPDKESSKYKLKPLFEVNTNGMLPGDSLGIRFKYPIEQFVMDSIFLQDTSGAALPLNIKSSTDGFAVSIKGDWLEVNDYKLEILPGAFYDIFDNSNDTVLYDFKTVSIDNLGEIIANIIGLDSTKTYSIILRKGNVELAKYLVEEESSYVMSIKNLKPDTYAISVIEDTNKNGKWDPVDYWNKTHPEVIKEFELEKLRENWTLETDVIYSSEEVEEEIEQTVQEEDK